MEGKLDITTLVLLGLAGALYLTFNHFFGVRLDEKEPPLIPSTIPFIGHIIGIIRSGTKYYAQLSAKNPLPIYTLGMLGGRTYVVNSPDLVIAVQRNSKTLSFTPMVVNFITRVGLPSKVAMASLMKNLNGEEGEWGLQIETHNGMHAALAPGAALDSMNQPMIRTVAETLDSLGTDQKVTINLASWVRHAITMASTDAVYGPTNPFKDPEVEDGFWAFEHDFTYLFINVLPNLLAPKGHQGRKAIFEGFTEYFGNGGPDTGSALIQARYNANAKNGVPIEDMARFEVGDLVGILVNTAPATFWTIVHAYCNPPLLEDLRYEISTVMTSTSKGSGFKGAHNTSSGPLRRLDITKMKGSCPLLISLFQEVLRVRSFNASIRKVTEDTILDDRYLLKKDSVIQMPSLVIHSDPSVWGATAKNFDAQRFMKKSDSKKQGEMKQHPGAFRAFGGGTTLCPGRHFATTEILSVVAMFVMRYDLVPVGGEWVLPTQNANNLATSVLPPDEDIRVHVTKRKGFEDGEWEFVLGESKASRFALSV